MARPEERAALDRFLDALARAPARVLLLDYDGTLVPLVPRYEAAGPDDALLELLGDLSSDKRTEVVIVSGRARAALERWFGGLDVSLVAEHGAFLRRRGGEWTSAAPTYDRWKASVRPVMELYMGRTPGARIEEKETSLVWHYRESDADLGTLRARELRHVLEPLVANEGLTLLEGSRVLEARTAGVDKGQVTASLLSGQQRDFIFAAGDDRTDEDMFAALPLEAWSVCVRRRGSRARYRVGSVHELRLLLGKMRG